MNQIKEKKFLIGITGSIGSGKSYVCDYLEKKGYPVLRADDIAKNILANDPRVRKKVIKKFGPRSFINNKPNIAYLAEAVFNNADNVAEINSIIHPPTLAAIEKEASNLFVRFPVVFVESALIYEADFSDMFNYVILIFSEEEERIKRVVERDKVEASAVKQRMKFQLPDKKKKQHADFVVNNDSTLNELCVRIDSVVKMIETLRKY